MSDNTKEILRAFENQAAKFDDYQNVPTPITNYALFHDGEYVTNEQMNEKKFLKLAGK